MDFIPSKGRGFVPKDLNRRSQAARLQGAVKNRGIKNRRRNSM